MPHVHIPYASSIGTPPANTALVYSGTDGAVRVKLSDGSDFRVGAGITPKRIPLGMSFLVPTDHQHIVHGAFTVEGDLVLDGDLVIL